MEEQQQKHHPNTSTPRPKRSNTNLSNLRLAPLSTTFLANDEPPAPHTDSSYTTHHSSYIQGKSAPSTPGILARSSSRRQLGGCGLSRKLSLYDIEAPSYAAVEVDGHGVPLHAASRARDPGQGIPKAKSEAALLARRRLHPRLQTQLSAHSGGGGGGGIRNHQRSHTGGAGGNSRHKSGRGEEVEEDWLSRAAGATHALLRESKGQSWHSTALVDDGSSASSDDDEAFGGLSGSAHRLHYADDELSPETPRYTSRWGSRFGSRAPSARTSRRGSRVDLLRTPMVAEAWEQGGGYFAQGVSERDELVEPDFVDGDEGVGEDTTEDEIARLARDRSFGLGGLVDRLVGWTLFSVDEDREATDVEEDEDAGARTLTASVAARGMLQVQRPPVQDVQPEVQEEGGWHDAAWLLSLATKVIL